MGVDIQLGVDVSDRLEAMEHEYDAIFLGVGLGVPHRMNVPGEDLPGVIDALNFIAWL
jgi:glutamate synthase (NADPH/NADH) small chain